METEEKVLEKEVPQEGPKPKIVRNREVDKAASALAEDHLLPIPPGKTVSWEHMQQYLALLTPAMWSHIMIYAYRVKPKIRRQLRDPNSPNYIDCLTEPFTLDYFISRHGGGKYQLQAVDTETDRRSNSSQLFKCNFDINEVQYPPILDFAELELEARENKSYITWLQNQGILDSKGNVIQKPAQSAPTPPSATNNLSAKEVLDILGYAHKMSSEQQNQFRAQFAPGEDSLSKSVGQILLEKMKQDDPGKDFERMMTFVEKMNKPDGSFAQMLQMQQEQRKTDLEYTRLLLQNQNNNSPKSQLGELREIIGIAREFFSAGTGGRRSNWDTGLEIARDVVLPGLQTLGTTITNIMALQKGTMPVTAVPGVQAQPTPAVFDPYANPNAARQYASTLNAQQAQAPPQAPPPPPPAGPDNQLGPLFQQYGNLVINALNNGTAGFDFADSLTLLLGTATHAMICSQGETALVSTMMSIPEMAMFGESRIKQFTHEFVHYQEFTEGTEELEDEPLEPEVEAPPKIFRPAAARNARHA